MLQVKISTAVDYPDELRYVCMETGVSLTLCGQINQRQRNVTPHNYRHHYVGLIYLFQADGNMLSVF